MYLINIIIISIFFLSYSITAEEPNRKECIRRVYESCNHPKSFTEQEIENVRIYLIEKFAKTKPVRKPCTKLRVRKNINCLSQNEIKDYIAAVKTLAENGVMERITRNHVIYWPGTHKYYDGFNQHKVFQNDFAAELLKVNPDVDLPYWNFHVVASHPEKSLIWKYLGTAGTKDTDYCVTDGLLPNLTVAYPEKHCLRRQWDECKGKKVIPPWEPPEWATAIMQMGEIPNLNINAVLALIQLTKNITILTDRLKLYLKVLSSNDPPVQLYTQFLLLLAYYEHFKTHLWVGGWAGDMSVPLATNDPLFFPMHEFQSLTQLKWQLQDDRNLCPKTFNLGLSYSYILHDYYNPDIDKDVFIAYPNVTVLESFQQGYGDYCYIWAELIKPINDMLNNKKQELPIAVKRLKECLPPKKFERYFPRFALCPDKVNFFDYNLPDVGNCNARQPNVKCRPLKIAKKYTDTANGLRQWKAFANSTDVPNGIDITPILLPGEAFYEEFMNDLIKCGYCSPYA